MTSLARTCEILSDLVAFPTVSSDSNLALVDYAANLLSEAGAECIVTRDETGQKANLFATLGPRRDGGIVLSGHTDVVPVDGQDWTSDPFRMIERDGRLYGRGTCDMKGFVAVCLAMAPIFAGRLARPLHMAFTYDEEIGCAGARALTDSLSGAGMKPAIAIIGEPTQMRVVEGHKGCFEYTTEFIGLDGHGSRPDCGVNAVEYAVRYVARLMELAEEIKARAPLESRFEPPWTTIQVGRMSGGTARNIIAGHCMVEWEMRPVTNADAEFVKRGISAYAEEVLKPAMRAVYAGADIVTRTLGEVRGLAVERESAARELVCELTGQREAGLVAFGTEAGLFQAAGMSAVICGPGSIAQAHKPDEFIALDQLAACITMLERLRERLAS
jgi:acetylornithine deacetylase